MTSRDVIFDEQSPWNWEAQQLSHIVLDSAIEEDEEGQQLLQQNPRVSTPERPQNDVALNETSPKETECASVTADSQHRRSRKRPTWMQDYEVTGVKFDNFDSIAHYACYQIVIPLHSKKPSWT